MNDCEKDQKTKAKAKKKESEDREDAIATTG